MKKNKNKEPKNQTGDSGPKNTPANNSGARKRIERLFKTVSLIENATANDKKINVKHLMDELEVDRSTVMRDIDFLRDLEMEVEWDHAKETYDFSGNEKYIPSMELGKKDYLLLEFIQQSLAQYAQTEMGQEMLKTFQRLFGIFTGRANWNKWSKSVYFRLGYKTAKAQMEIRSFHILDRAIHKRHIVSFTYKSPKSSRPREKKIEPHLMVMNEGRWYLYGTDTTTRRLTPFAFPRMRDLVMTDEKFQADPPRDPRALLEHSFGCAISSEPPYDIVVEFEPEVAERVKESVWHLKQTLTDLPGGRVQLTLPLNNDLEVRSWILSWGPYARVVAPQNLAQEIAGTIQKMAARTATNA
jgi:predicted DNA-binding transcriptional regulator YafY